VLFQGLTKEDFKTTGDVAVSFEAKATNGTFILSFRSGNNTSRFRNNSLSPKGRGQLEL
jgi:hypothetical protein